MKFIDAWDSLAKENHNLKTLLFILTAVACFLTIGLISAATKDPLVFEHGCVTRPIFQTKGEATPAEVTDFLREAIIARFNSNGENSFYLSGKQQALRDQEQKELESRSMKQTVVLQSVEFEKDKIVVSADRLISMGEIRSAFKFPLLVKVETTNRSVFNPYGLVLVEVDQIKEKAERK